MERRGSVVAPYKPGPDGQLRPYLLLTLIGVKPGAEVEILGLYTGTSRDEASQPVLGPVYAP